MKTVYQKYRTLVPAILLLLVSIYGNFTFDPTLKLYQDGDAEVGFNPVVSIAVILSVATCLIYFVFRKLYRYVLFGVLFLGFFNVVHFAGSTSYYIKMGALKVSFQPSVMLIAVLTYILFFGRINRFLSNNHSGDGPVDSTIAEAEREKRVIAFMERFATHTPGQLQEIKEGEKYSADAKEAASRLLGGTYNPQT